MTLHPVQVLVVGFEDPTPTGEALAELARLESAGVVRLIDVLLVRRDEDGALETLDIGDGRDPAPGRIAAEFFSATGAPSDEDAAGAVAEGVDNGTAGTDDAWSLLDAVPVGGVAAVALIEHVWAGPLREALARAGGSPLEDTWLASDDLAILQGILER